MFNFVRCSVMTVREYKEVILINLSDFCSRRYGDMD